MLIIALGLLEAAAAKPSGQCPPPPPPEAVQLPNATSGFLYLDGDGHGGARLFYLFYEGMAPPHTTVPITLWLQVCTCTGPDLLKQEQTNMGRDAAACRAPTAAATLPPLPPLQPTA